MKLNPALNPESWVTLTKGFKLKRYTSVSTLNTLKKEGAEVGSWIANETEIHQVATLNRQHLRKIKFFILNYIVVKKKNIIDFLS